MPARRLPTALLVLLLALVPAACGSDSSGTTGQAGSGSTAPAPGAAEFRSQGEDNSIQEFGEEASGADLKQAAAALHAFLDARAAGEWDAACERLAPAVSAELVRQLGAQGGEKLDCGEILAGLAGAVPPQALREAAEVDVGALRAEGDSGFLLFRDARGEAFFVPVRREGGDWRVAAIAPSPLP